jgi:ankyrin repeat protein
MGNKLSSGVVKRRVQFIEVTRAIKREDTPKIAELMNEDPGLILCSDQDGNSLLHFAIYHKSNCRTIEYLINLGADVNSTTQLDSDTPLHWACYYGNETVAIQLLCRLGADPSQKNKVIKPHPYIDIAETIICMN